MANPAPPSMPFATPPPAPKKGSSGLAIAGGGCLVVIVILVLLVGFGLYKLKGFLTDFQKNPAKVTAMLVVKANPDLEIVNTNDATGEVTIHNKKTNETITTNFEELSKGKLTVKNAKGETTSYDASQADKKGVVVKSSDGSETVIGGSQVTKQLPAWVPLYDALKEQAGGVRTVTTEGVKGLYAGDTPDDFAKVKQFYLDKLNGSGFKVDEVNLPGAATTGRNTSIFTGKKDDKYVVSVTLTTDNGETVVNVHYEGPKE